MFIRQITKEQEEKARAQFLKNIENVDQNDIEYASKKGLSQLENFGDNPPKFLMKIWNDIKLMISLITDYTKGNYKEAPWKVMASITGAVIYFISPIDAIPDVIPIIGYLDDSLVIKLALDYAGDDLAKYQNWKNS